MRVDPLEVFLKRVAELRDLTALLPAEPMERLRLRRSLGLSRREVARVVGCAPATLRRLETEPSYLPRSVDTYVLHGLVAFYQEGGFDPSSDINDEAAEAALEGVQKRIIV